MTPTTFLLAAALRRVPHVAPSSLPKVLVPRAFQPFRGFDGMGRKGPFATSGIQRKTKRAGFPL